MDPAAPYVNQIVHFAAAVSPSQEAPKILDWHWTFGDGATAEGKEVWHEFRSYNLDGEGQVAPWDATVTATHENGSKYVAVSHVTLKSEGQSGVAGYYLRHATAGCTDETGSRPQPSGPSLQYVGQEDVLTGWWRVDGTAPFCLIAELHFVPSSMDRVQCRWVVYSRGQKRTGMPEVIADYPADVRSVQHNAPYYYNVGFPLRISPASLFPESGWYQVYAEVSSMGGQYRTYVDFMLQVDID